MGVLYVGGQVVSIVNLAGILVLVLQACSACFAVGVCLGGGRCPHHVRAGCLEGCPAAGPVPPLRFVASPCSSWTSLRWCRLVEARRTACMRIRVAAGHRLCSLVV